MPLGLLREGGDAYGAIPQGRFGRIRGRRARGFGAPVPQPAALKPSPWETPFPRG